jgi:lipoprotein-releasing system ATP-binding protein
MGGEDESTSVEAPPVPLQGTDSLGKLKRDGGLIDNRSGSLSTEPALWVRDLHKGYGTPQGVLQVLKGVDLECRPGESVAVIGASGVGKSTLLHLLGALDRPDSGEVRVAGRDPFALGESERALLRNRSIGFVFQFHHLLPEFTAAENVALPLWIAGQEQAPGLSEATSLLVELGLADRARARPDELSGGERQRLAIARALVTRPAVLLADEPTGNLDGETAGRVYNKLVELTQRRRAVLVVATHDLELAARTDRVFRLRQGRLLPSP